MLNLLATDFSLQAGDWILHGHKTTPVKGESLEQLYNGSMYSNLVSFLMLEFTQKNSNGN